MAADLFLKADMTKIWSTHKPDGFLFPAKGGPQPFTYEAGVGGVIKGYVSPAVRLSSQTPNDLAGGTTVWQPCSLASVHG